MTRKKKQQISKLVHYIFVFNHKMSKQDKAFIFIKMIYEHVLLFVAYILTNKDLLFKKTTLVIKPQQRRHTHCNIKIYKYKINSKAMYK